jgi:response regulator NasT
MPRKPEAPRILLVEDNEPMRLLLGELLRQEGYQLLEAPDGVSALVLAEEKTPDLVVLDLALPGMSGLEVADRLRGWMPFMVITVDREDHSIQACLDQGALGYALKPPDPENFVLQVRTALVRGKETLNLRRALQETQHIAKALGMLMVYFQLSQEAAYRTLVARASAEKRRSADVAAEVIAAFECIQRFKPDR